MMCHAFDELKAIRISLKTDSRNLRSQAAIERLGAKREGVLRNHILYPDGYRRASVYFSVIEEEWPQVKTRLESFLAR
jgi:N-acetyltransferase